MTLFLNKIDKEAGLQNFNIERICLYVVVSLIPLSYTSLLGVRLIALSPLLLIFLSWRMGIVKSLVTSRSFQVCILLMLYICFFSISDYSFLFSYLVFCTFLYWPLFFKKKSESDFQIILSLYLGGVLFTVAGVLAQAYLFSCLGIKIGRLIVYGDHRLAFSFMWNDFSFLSLYLASSIPLTFFRYKKKNAFILSSLIFFASCLTSARTGPYSFIVFFLILLILALLDSSKRKTLRSEWKSILVVLLVMFSSIKVSRSITMRNVSLEGSGRMGVIDIFLKDFASNNSRLFFGNGFSHQLYYDQFGILPHNWLLYLVAMGGVVFAVLFVCWIISLGLSIKRWNIFLVSSASIALLGFNFIPSVFAAYFFSFILAMFIVYDRIQIGLEK